MYILSKHETFKVTPFIITCEQTPESLSLLMDSQLILFVLLCYITVSAVLLSNKNTWAGEE